MRSIEQLTQEALSLPRESRELLAEQLVESLELDIDPAIQAVWNAEAKKRLEEIRSGAVAGIPGEEALARVRQIFGQ
ncbi:MAG: addiction module protein [Coleofasciculaceae cyanobacterium SM2_1_6]|nr:addiction module protein [Coleofasciculaceae cyanobacterium SM2_1_6]